MNVFVTRHIPEAGFERLRRSHMLRVAPFDRAATRAELLEGVRGADAVVSLLTDTIDAEVLDAAGPQLRIVANYAAGVDNIDLPEAQQRGIVVTNTPDVLTDSVAEHTMALLLALAKRIVEGDHLVHEGRYQGWEPELLLGTELKGRTLGVVGLGRIGSEVARKAFFGFGMDVVYLNRHRDLSLEKDIHATPLSLDQLLKASDVVTLHVPLTPQTRHLIGAPELKKMKRTASIINTARGPILDEVALVEALQKKTIAGAALDVFEHEPAISLGLLELPNVVLTPHTASATTEARTRMSLLVADNILAVLDGRPAVTPVVASRTGA